MKLRDLLRKPTGEVPIPSVEETTMKEAVARDPKKTTVKSAAQTLSQPGQFQEPEIDFQQVYRAYMTDSYIRRAVDRHVGGMFKSGWELKSKNDKASDYVWLRMKLMAETTRIPTDMLLRQMAFDFVLFSNTYLLKSRAKKNVQIPGMTAVGYTNKQPIAGYFPMSPVTVQIEHDEYGNVTKYQQSANGTDMELAETEVAHIAYRRPTNMPYGMPTIHNVLQDVLLLRQMEDNIYRLVHKHLFPKTILTVGLDKPGFEATDEDLDDAEAAVRRMQRDSVWIVPERYKATTIGGDAASLDASAYLKYFRQRVFTGLGVSDSVMGIGDTANKSTSDNMSADLNDVVKEFQENFAIQFQQQVINELLFEGGFDPTLNPDDEVLFVFTEVEQAAKIARENHVMQLYLGGVLTFEELRLELGRDGEVDESRLHFNMTGAVNRDAESAAGTIDGENQPENQSGKQSSPDTKKRESRVGVAESKKKEANPLTPPDQLVNFTTELNISSFESRLVSFWDSLKEDWSLKKEMRPSELELGKTLLKDLMRREGQRHLESALVKGIGPETAALNQDETKVALAKVRVHMTSAIEKLIDDLAERVSREGTDVSAVFQVLGYRVRLVAKNETFRAYNLGRCLAAIQAGESSVTWAPHEGACEKCQAASEIRLTGDWMDRVPPHHAGCVCVITFGEGGSQ